MPVVQEAIVGLSAKHPNNLSIKLKKSYFDCKGKQNMLIQCLVMPEKLVIDAINNKNEWNSKFNRKYVSAIERKLKIDLSDIIR